MQASLRGSAPAARCRPAGAARPRRRAAVAVRAASDRSSDAGPSDREREAGRRAALACGCAACAAGAFALLGGPRAAAAAAAADPGYLSRPRGGAYDEYFAEAMGGMEVYESEVAALKRRLFGELARDLLARKSRRRSGDDASASVAGEGYHAPITLLELGVGRGPNFAALAEAVRDAGGDIGRGDVRVVGVDPNPAMLPHARDAADAAGFPRGSVELRALYGEQLGEAFGGEKFDAAVVTLVLCSVPDPAETLGQLRRVVKSSGSRGRRGGALTDGRMDGGDGDGEGDDEGGRLLLIEHVRDPSSTSLRRLGQEVLNPLQRLLADGCNLNRDTEGALRRAGLLDGDNARRLRRLEVDGLGLLAPHLAGVLRL